MKLDIGVLVVGLVGLTACEEVIDLDPVDRRAPIEADVRPKPIIGGTLVVTSDGIAVAADPDRDLIHVVDVAERKLRHTITLEPGEEPGRVVQGSGSLVHVVLRGGGGIATIDDVDGTIVSRRKLCPDPRGMAFDAGQSTLHVACADGTLVSLPESGEGETIRTMLEPDLRDVVLTQGLVLVSRFRAASIVGKDGGALTIPTFEGSFEANVAWRTVPAPDGRLVMLHQLSDKNPVPIEPAPEDGGKLPYGGDGNFCQPGISNVALSMLSVDGSVWTTRLSDAPLSVDVAISPDSEWIVVAMPGAPEGTGSVGLLSGLDPEGCFMRLLEEDDQESEEQITAVAFGAEGTLVMQSREPARLVLEPNLPFRSHIVIPLEGASRYDSGHEIFHRKTDSGLSCASCHPEGSDDGFVWRFERLGERRTQPLDVGLADTAPFHWDGDMGDIDVLMDEVLAHRMGGKRQTQARGESFTRWLFEQQRPPADAGLDDPGLVAQGEDLFTAYDCVRCHTGPELGGTMTTPIRGKELQVPSLRRVSLHPPYMHDGRAPTLVDSVRDMLETTTDTVGPPSAQDVQALTAYLRTL